MYNIFFYAITWRTEFVACGQILFTLAHELIFNARMINTMRNKKLIIKLTH